MIAYDCIIYCSHFRDMTVVTSSRPRSWMQYTLNIIESYQGASYCEARDLRHRQRKALALAGLLGFVVLEHHRKTVELDGTGSICGIVAFSEATKNITKNITSQRNSPNFANIKNNVAAYSNDKMRCSAIQEDDCISGCKDTQKSQNQRI